MYCIVLYCIVLYCNVLYRIVSYRIVSYRIASHRIASHHITSHHITSHHITSHYNNVSYNHSNVPKLSNTKAESLGAGTCARSYHHCVTLVAYVHLTFSRQIRYGPIRLACRTTSAMLNSNTGDLSFPFCRRVKNASASTGLDVDSVLLLYFYYLYFSVLSRKANRVRMAFYTETRRKLCPSAIESRRIYDMFEYD